MAQETAHLGKLVAVNAGVGLTPPDDFDIYQGITSAQTNGLQEMSDKEVADKAAAASNDAPSTWFVNFPDETAFEQKQKLATYLQSILDYRCWASLVWWKTVFNQPKIPQGNSKQDRARQSEYCAKVAMKHMKQTPWLGMNIDHTISKHIRSKVTEFHTELIQAVLEGFVGITPKVVDTLEKILNSIAKSSSNATDNAETNTLVCEKYEYVKEADVIKSYVRIINFSITESMRNVNNAKKTEQIVQCDIEYNEYEAIFNKALWDETAETIHAEQKKAAIDFTKEQTIDCDP